MNDSDQKNVAEHPNSTPAQRRRLLAALQEAGATGITTLDARHRLDILMPAARVFELRNVGFDISTSMVTQASETGERHLVARYVLDSMHDATAA